MATEPLLVPLDQRHLPRAERQFPFRPLDDTEQAEVREEAGRAIAGINKAIFKNLNAHASSSFTRDDIEDAAQEIRLRLLINAIPRFDTWRKPRTKLSTFLVFCSRRLTLEILRSHRRRQLAGRPEPIELHTDRLVDRDRSRDGQIDRLTQELLVDPSRLGKHAAAIIHRPHGQSETDLARSRGIKNNTLAIARYDARQRAVALLDAA